MQHTAQRTLIQQARPRQRRVTIQPGPGPDCRFAVVNAREAVPQQEFGADFPLMQPVCQRRGA